MATPIEANRPLNASVCCWVTPASSTVDAGRDGAVGLERVDGRLDGRRDGAGVLAEDLGGDRRGRGLVDAGDAALDVGLLDGRDLLERDLGDGPDRAAGRSSSTEVVASGSTWMTRSIGWPGSRVTWVTVWATSAVRTSLATWAAVRPTANALVGSTVTWISGVALTRSLWRLARSGLSVERGDDGRGRRSTTCRGPPR